MRTITFWIISLITLCSIQTFSQQKIDISGTVIDSSGTGLSYSSILLLEPTDSALVSYVLTNDKGEFSFKNIARKPLLIKATFVGYLPHQELLEMPQSGDLKLSPMTLLPISQELYEVVVKTAKAPISIKGDTIEYDASKFKVPPGASLEDMLRKLPGVQIDANGNIIAQGEQVQKVTVDGRRFFGNNTKMATQNLTAESISKVQIFNDKSEQSKLTGIQDGQREKTLNVELKDEARKGGFGKISVAAGGADNRWKTNGMFNKFDKVNQFSIIGYGNNTNESGLGWDDLQDFRGSGNTFGASNAGIFGFNGDSQTIYIVSGDNEESFDIPYNNMSSGFSDNQGAGINYNRVKNKKDLNSSYFFSRSNQTIKGFESRTNLLENNQTFGTTDDNTQKNLAGHHRMNFRYVNEIDSLNTLTVLGQARYSDLANSLNSLQQLIRSETTSSSMVRNNASDRYSMAYQGTAILRHKFQKNGRSMSLSAANGGSKADTEGTQKSIVDLAQSSDPTSYFKNLDQLNQSLNGSQNLRAGALFIEPLRKTLFLETFYNFSRSGSRIDRQIYDVKGDAEDELNTDLSRFFHNVILTNNLGSSIRYSSKGNNLAFGLAGTRFDLNGDFSVRESDPLLGRVDKSYNVITPNVSFTKSMKSNRYLSLNYTMRVTPPSLSDLQPFKDISNPLYIREGNPDLLPQSSHNISTSFNKYDPATFIRLYFYVAGSFHKNQVVQNQTIDPNTLITTYSPGNVSGGNSFNSYVNFGFPIVKNKTSVNLTYTPSINNYISLINNTENKTKTMTNSFSASFDLTPIDRFSFYTGYNFSLSSTQYKVNAAQNQEIYNNRIWARTNIKLPRSFYIDSDFNYTMYRNDRLGFNQKIPIWNAFAYKLLGEKKKWEIRLSANDLLNKNVRITQQASQNFVLFREVNTLARYFLIGVTYNMRGVEIKKY
jgi:hypothetical protein